VALRHDGATIRLAKGVSKVLRYKADRRTLFFVGIYFTLLIGAYVFVDPAWFLEPARLWYMIPLLLALMVLSFMGAVATHNTVHCPVFEQRWLNKIFQVVLTLTYGHPVSAYVPGHNLSHHKHTQTRKDVMRTTKARFRYNLLNGALFPVLVGLSIMKGESAYFKSMKQRLPRWYRQYRVEFYVFWATQVGLLVIDWKKFLVFWLLPHLYAQWGIITMNMLQHDGCDEESKYNHSRNFVGKAVNFWTYNNGYHSIHHDHPGLHWSLAPATHAKEYGGKIHPNLEQKSLVWYILRTFFLNKREKYDGTPLVLPEAGKDEDWIPKPEEVSEDLGAERPQPA
jgi:fatty acid desaturase